MFPLRPIRLLRGHTAALRRTNAEVLIYLANKTVVVTPEATSATTLTAPSVMTAARARRRPASFSRDIASRSRRDSNDIQRCLMDPRPPPGLPRSSTAAPMRSTLNTSLTAAQLRQMRDSRRRRPARFAASVVAGDATRLYAPRQERAPDAVPREGTDCAVGIAEAG